MSVRDATRPVLAPFEQLPYETLPERPRRPHPFHKAETADVVVDSQPFGRLNTRVTSYGPPGAPPLLLVHGLMTAGYSWRYLLASSLAERHRLVIPDLPGCGRSGAAGRPPPDRARARHVHRRAAGGARHRGLRRASATRSAATSACVAR